MIWPVWFRIFQYFKFYFKFYPMEIIMAVNKDLASEIFFFLIEVSLVTGKQSVISCMFMVHSYHEMLGNHSKLLWEKSCGILFSIKYLV